MGTGAFRKSLFCLLCISLSFLIGGFSGTLARASEKGIPIGEMISRGEVRFEARENQWKSVEPSYFPVFQGIKIKTDKGAASIALGGNTQIDLAEESLVYIEQSNKLTLAQGRADFRFSPASETSIGVRGLRIISPRPLQASRGPAAGNLGNGQDAIGSIMIHPNGAVTVKSHQGGLSVVGQDRTVLTTLSSKGMVTIPSAVASGSQRLAQAGDPPPQDSSKKEGEAAVELAAGAGAGAAAGAAAGAVLGGSEALLIGVGAVAGGALGGVAVYNGTTPRDQIPQCCVCFGARNGTYPCP